MLNAINVLIGKRWWDPLEHVDLMEIVDKLYTLFGFAFIGYMCYFASYVSRVNLIFSIAKE